MNGISLARRLLKVAIAVCVYVLSVERLGRGRLNAKCCMLIAYHLSVSSAVSHHLRG
jgi:hypothetical protein